ncbi:MAG: type 1 glutamine amidotransferase [Proteobacteria bacterium]|nr:type 1 glutamine amidotransferase [Pseudomonadota bacterium]MBU1648594.1 type 1 glutamine amidotransferase [Pseudomonadota bacterium]MBU1985860.1 type 1 glutamine amidotransferase [Pseudomonadota bacterium]
MRIHWLQHVDFEGLGTIEKWVGEKGHTLSCTRLFAGDILPELDAFNMLIVMGGPMGVHDQREYPWLQEEKAFLLRVIAAGKPILGVCLGAQLLADVLGARVFPNKEKEIGWFQVVRACVVPERLASVLPVQQTVFHWHGDTFALPEKAIRLYSSAACVNQAFVYEERVIGLQFHLETTPDSVITMIEKCRAELVPAPWIQKEKEMLAVEGEVFVEINTWMSALLDYLAQQHISFTLS